MIIIRSGFSPRVTAGGFSGYGQRSFQEKRLAHREEATEESSSLGFALAIARAQRKVPRSYNVLLGEGMRAKRDYAMLAMHQSGRDWLCTIVRIADSTDEPRTIPCARFAQTLTSKTGPGVQF